MNSVIETQNTQKSESHIQKNRQKDMKPKRWEKFIISSNFFKLQTRDFPGGWVFKTLCSQGRGPGSVPGQGTPECSRVQPNKICRVCNQEASGATAQSPGDAVGISCSLACYCLSRLTLEGRLVAFSPHSLIKKKKKKKSCIVTPSHRKHIDFSN